MKYVYIIIFLILSSSLFAQKPDSAYFKILHIDSLVYNSDTIPPYFIYKLTHKNTNDTILMISQSSEEFNDYTLIKTNNIYFIKYFDYFDYFHIDAGSIITGNFSFYMGEKIIWDNSHKNYPIIGINICGRYIKE